MRLAHPIPARSVGLVLLLAIGMGLAPVGIPAHGADPAEAPAPGTAPGFAARFVAAAGPGARTLLVHDGARLPYTLADTLEMVALRLRTVTGVLQTEALERVTTNLLAGADYVVLLTPRQAPSLTSELLDWFARTNCPVLWIGPGAEQLERLPPYADTFRALPGAAPFEVTNVWYRGTNWALPPIPWLPYELNPASEPSAVELMRAETPEGTRPLCWRVNTLTVFGALPWEGVAGHLFGDVLLDFYGVNPPPPPRILLRVDSVHPRSDPRRIMRLADYLEHRRLPFLLAVVPAVESADGKTTADLEGAPALVRALQYAARRGGRVLLRGSLGRETGGEAGLFWNVDLDRPGALDAPGATRERLHKSLESMVRLGVFPIGWQTPGYAASRTAYSAIAESFSTGMERVQLSDATRLEVHTPSAPTLDAFGRLIFPENTGTVDGSMDDARAVADFLDRVRLALRFRGGVAGCYFQADRPFEEWVKFVEALRSLDASFLDPMDWSHWVRWPGGLLMTGEAERTVAMGRGALRWAAWDAAGRPAGREIEPEREAGEVLLKRRGDGVMEIYEFNEPTP